MIERIVKPFINPIQRKLLRPLKRAKNWPKLVAKSIRRFFKSILGQKEVSKASYIAIGNYYISKKLIVIVVIVILVLYFFLFIKPPKFIDKLFNRVPAVTVDASGVLPAISGNAKVYDSKDGKGKQLVYEGALLNGAYNGFGKLYNSTDGALLYEGQFKDSLFDGTGKQWSEDGWLRYEGSFSIGKYNGKGRLYRSADMMQPNEATGQEQLLEQDKLLEQEGLFEDGWLVKGKLYSANGLLLYDGELQKGQYEGKGIIYRQNHADHAAHAQAEEQLQVEYDGQLKAGKPHGDGRLYSGEGLLVYEGEFANGIYSGNGALNTPKGQPLYKGSFLTGLYHGDGKQFYTEGTIAFEGQFNNGERSGAGKAYFADGTVQYEGGWLAGQYDGTGTIYNNEGNLLYTGSFSKGKYHGNGELYGKQGQIEHKGAFLQGKLNGLGEWYSEHNQLIYKGYFLLGMPDPGPLMKMSPIELEQLLGKPTAFELLPDDVPSDNNSAETAKGELIQTASIDSPEAGSIEADSMASAGSHNEEANQSNTGEPVMEQESLPQGVTKILHYKALGLIFQARSEDGNVENMIIEELKLSNKAVVQAVQKQLQFQYDNNSEAIKRTKSGAFTTYIWNDLSYKLTSDSKGQAQFAEITLLKNE